MHLEFLVSQLLFSFPKEEAVNQRTVHLEVIVYISNPPRIWSASLERSDNHEKREFESALELARYLERIVPVRARTVGLR